MSDIFKRLKDRFNGQLKQQQTNFAKKNPTIKPQHNTSKPQFEIPDRDNIPVLNGVIVGNTVYNEFRSDPNSDQMPECVSVGGIHGTRFGTCANCSHAVWRDENGKRFKECKSIDHLAIVLTEENNDTVYEMKIPTSSRKNFYDYMKEFTNKEAGLGSCVTQFTLTPTKSGKSTYSVINFTAGEELTEHTSEELLNRVDKGFVTVEENNFFPYTPKSEAVMSSAVTAAPEMKSIEDKTVEDATVVSVETEDIVPF